MGALGARMMLFRKIAVVVAVLLMAGRAWAWGPEGHRIVARIAELRLTEGARTNVTALLEAGEQVSDEAVASWADVYRQEMIETGPWHYINIPFEAKAYDAARDCEFGQCVIVQVERAMKELANPEAGLVQRQHALRFLVHFVGDLHQPLHTTSRADDRGGNLCPVVFPGAKEATTLHGVWDYDLVRALVGTNDLLHVADGLDAASTVDEVKRWQGGGVADWAWEGHVEAMKQAYAGIPPTNGVPFALTQDYVEGNREVVKKRMQAAGVRLAMLLNGALR